MEAHYRRADLKVRRRAADGADVEVRRRAADVQIVDVSRDGALELRRFAAGVGTWRYGALEAYGGMSMSRKAGRNWMSGVRPRDFAP